MKITLLTALTLIATAPLARAACTDHWGNSLQLRHVRDQVIALTFESGRYPASGHLKYSGRRAGSSYFRGNGHTAEIEDSVFERRAGRIWYHYFDSSSGDRGRVELVTFTCR